MKNLRKLQKKVNSSTISVSIPKSIATILKLDSGEYVNVTLEDTKIIIEKLGDM